MLARTLARISSVVPSRIKYALAGCKGIYTTVLAVGQPTMEVQTRAGNFRWKNNALTSQEFLLGTYETYMQQAFLEHVCEGNVVYDVGAHAGFHTLVSGLLAGPHGSIIAFEPNPQNFKLLQQQITLNPKINARALPYAISDRCHDMRLDTSPGSSQGRLSQQGKIAVDARSIDSLVNSGECPPPSVMKIDVEGHEKEVLLGAMETVRKHRPTVFCDYNDGSTYSLISSLLQAEGYTITEGPPVIATPQPLSGMKGPVNER
jgi:FkbM family methyltransferase